MEFTETIIAEINWLSKIIEERVVNVNVDFYSIIPPQLTKDSIYSSFINDNKISADERLLLISTLVPNIYPVYFYERFEDKYFSKTIHSHYVECPKFICGITKSTTSNSFLPTGHTFLYLVSGSDFKRRIEIVSKIFEKKYITIQKNIIYPIANSQFDPTLSNILAISQNHAIAFLTNNSTYLT